MVSITAGETETIDFTIIKGGTVEGHVTLYAVPEKKPGELQKIAEDNGSYTEDDLIVDSGFPNVLMQIKYNGETRRVLTDRSGFFAFYDMRPGRWTLSVTQASLPRYHEFVEESFEFEIEPGDRKTATFKIFPVKRPVTTMLQGGTISLSVQKPETDGIELQSARAALTDLDLLAKELRRTGLPRNENKPKLMNLGWGLAPGAIDAALTDLNTNFSGLRHASENGVSENRDLQTEPTVKFLADGIGYYDLGATATFTFLNPKQEKSALLLSEVEIHLSSRDMAGNTVDLEKAFEELCRLFWAKWRIPMIGVEKDTIFDSGKYRTSVNDVSALFEMIDDEEGIRIIYSSEWFSRILRSALPERD